MRLSGWRRKKCRPACRAVRALDVAGLGNILVGLVKIFHIGAKKDFIEPDGTQWFTRCRGLMDDRVKRGFSALCFHRNTLSTVPLGR
jgi:hypothetical protein